MNVTSIDYTQSLLNISIIFYTCDQICLFQSFFMMSIFSESLRKFLLWCYYVRFYNLCFKAVIFCDYLVMRLDGSVPVKYGLRLNMDEKYRTLKKELENLTSIASNQMLFVEINGPIVKVWYITVFIPLIPFSHNCYIFKNKFILTIPFVL